MSAYSEGDRQRDGAAYDDALPHARVSRSGTNCDFNASGNGASLDDDLAYCIYGFTLAGYVDAPELKLRWDELPDPPPLPMGKAPSAAVPLPPYWIGLANFEAGHWDWFDGPYDGLFSIPLAEGATGLGPYRDGGSGHVFVAIITAYPGCSLREVLLGRPGWVHTWGHPYVEGAWQSTYVRDIGITTDGCVYAVVERGDETQTSYLTLLKYSAEGALLWQREFDASFGRGRVLPDDNGGCYLAGCGMLGLHTLRIASDGALIWQRCFSPQDMDSDLWVLSLAAGQPDGAVLMAGGVLSSLHGHVLLDYSPNGDLRLARDLDPTPASNEDRGGVIAADGGYYCSGAPGITRLASDGSVVWRRQLVGFYAAMGGVVADGNGRIFAGTLDGPYGSPHVVCMDQDGTLLWCKQYGAGYHVGQALLFRQGALYMLQQGGGANCLVVRLNTDGQVQAADAYQLVQGGTFALCFAIDAGGRQYLGGGVRTGNAFMHSWGPGQCTGQTITCIPVNDSMSTAASTGSQLDSSGLWIPASGIEDSLEPGVVADETAFILRRE